MLSDSHPYSQVRSVDALTSGPRLCLMPSGGPARRRLRLPTSLGGIDQPTHHATVGQAAGSQAASQPDLWGRGLHPTLLGMELLGDRGWAGQPRRRVTQDPVVAIDDRRSRDRCVKWPVWPKRALRAPKRPLQLPQESRSGSARRGWDAQRSRSHTEIARSRNRRRFHRRTTVTAPRTPSIACIAERDRGATMFSGRRAGHYDRVL